jgi:hypothetical protein
VRPGNLRGAQCRPTRTVKGMSGRPKSCSIRTTKTYRGIAYGARALRRGVPIVVAGVTTCQGGRESRTTGQRGTGDQDTQRREVCAMQGAETVLSVIRDLLYHPKMITGEPVTGKLVRRVRERADGKGPEPRAPRRRPISLGGGRRKRTSTTGTSSAAYPTCTPGSEGGCTEKARIPTGYGTSPCSPPYAG